MLIDALWTVAAGLAFGATACALLLFCGFGVSRLLLPARFETLEWLCMPIVGMAWLSVLAYQLLFSFQLNLPIALGIILVLSLALNVWAIKTVPRPLRGHWSETRWVWLLAAATFGLCLLPLLRYGYLTVIGENWDVEFYLPIADYLKTFAPALVTHAPPNPLKPEALDLLNRIPLPSTYFNGMLSWLVGRRAIETFAISIAVWRGLGIVGLGVFTLGTLGMGTRKSVLALLWVALNAIAIWIAFDNFEMHVAALALLPLALAFGFEWGGHLEWRALVLTTLLAAALFLTFNPAFVLWGLPIASYVLLRFVLGNERRRLLTQSVMLGGLIALWLIPVAAQLRGIYENFYGVNYANIGLRRFVQPAEIYGLGFFRINPISIGKRIGSGLGNWIENTESALTWAVVAVSAVFFAATLRHKGQREIWAALVLPYVALMLALVFVLKNPYGFFKTGSIVFLVLAPLAIEGLFAASAWLRQTLARRAPALARGAPAVVLLLLFSLVLFNAGLEFEPRLAAPGFFNRDVIALATIPTQLSPGASVYLSDSERLSGLMMGAIGYFLLDHPTAGNVNAGFSQLHNLRRGTLSDYGLFYVSENPREQGYEDESVWKNTLVKVAAGQPGVMRHFDLNRSTADRSSLQPVYPAATANASLALSVNATSVQIDAMPQTLPTGDPEPLTLNLITLAAQKITLSDDSDSTEFALAAGASLVTLAAKPLPRRLQIETQSAEPVWLTWVEYGANTQPSGSVAARWDIGVFQPLMQTQGTRVDVRVRALLPQNSSLNWIVDVRGLAKGTGIGIPLLNCSVNEQGSFDLTLHLTLDTPECHAEQGGVPLEVAEEKGKAAAGRFSVYLSALADGQVLDTVELGTFDFTKDGFGPITPAMLSASFFKLP